MRHELVIVINSANSAEINHVQNSIYLCVAQFFGLLDVQSYERVLQIDIGIHIYAFLKNSQFRSVRCRVDSFCKGVYILHLVKNLKAA